MISDRDQRSFYRSRQETNKQVETSHNYFQSYSRMARNAILCGILFIYFSIRMTFARILAFGGQIMKHKMKRREFIGKAAFGMMAAGFSTPFAKKVLAGEEKPPKVIYRTLGRTELRIPIVSFGSSMAPPPGA